MVPVLERYHVMFPYLFIPLHFALRHYVGSNKEGDPQVFKTSLE